MQQQRVQGVGKQCWRVAGVYKQTAKGSHESSVLCVNRPAFIDINDPVISFDFPRKCKTCQQRY